MTKKTWQEKLGDKSSLPKVLKLQKGFPCYNAVHKMGAEAGDDVVLANPSEVIEIMRQVPKGKLVTLEEICKRIARQHSVQASGRASEKAPVIIYPLCRAGGWSSSAVEPYDFSFC